METVEIVKNFVLNELIPEAKIEDLIENQPLIESGIVDSLGVLQLVEFIENNFKLKIEAEELIPENFETLSSIASMITKIKN